MTLFSLNLTGCNEMGAKGFTFFQSFYFALRALPDMDRLKLFDAICCFAFDGEEPQLPENLQPFFELMRPNIEKSIADRDNGSKGGRGKK